jgi:hypothetical protein
MTPFQFDMPEGFKFPSNYTNPYSFTGTDANGTYQGGGQMPLKTGTNTGMPGQVTTMPTGTQVRAAMAPPTTQAPSTPQGFTLPNGQYIPAFKISDIGHIPGERNPQYGIGDYGGPEFNTPGYYGLRNVSSYFPGWESLSPTNWQFTPYHTNPQYETNADGYATTGQPLGEADGLRLMLKSADKEGTLVNFLRQGDYWVPNQESLSTQEWDTNANNRARNLTLGAIAAMWGGPQLMAGGAAGGAEGAAAGFTPEVATTGGMSVPGAGGGMSVPGGVGFGTGVATPGWRNWWSASHTKHSRFGRKWTRGEWFWPFWTTGLSLWWICARRLRQQVI